MAARITRLLIWPVFLLTAATEGMAQDASFGIAAGAALPTGGLGANRSTGPMAQLSVCAGCRGRRVALRFDLEGAWFAGAHDAHPLSSSEGDLQVIGLIPTLVIGPRDDYVRPYLLIGAGAQSLSSPGRPERDRSVAGVRGGAGLRKNSGRIQLHAEFAAHVILSDHATGRDWSFGTYWPLAVGVRF